MMRRRKPTITTEAIKQQQKRNKIKSEPVKNSNKGHLNLYRCLVTFTLVTIFTEYLPGWTRGRGGGDEGYQLAANANIWPTHLTTIHSLLLQAASSTALQEMVSLRKKYVQMAPIRRPILFFFLSPTLQGFACTGQKKSRWKQYSSCTTFKYKRIHNTANWHIKKANSMIGISLSF